MLRSAWASFHYNLAGASACTGVCGIAHCKRTVFALVLVDEVISSSNSPVSGIVC